MAISRKQSYGAYFFYRYIIIQGIYVLMIILITNFIPLADILSFMLRFTFVFLASIMLVFMDSIIRMNFNIKKKSGLRKTRERLISIFIKSIIVSASITALISFLIDGNTPTILFINDLGSLGYIAFDTLDLLIYSIVYIVSSAISKILARMTMI